MGLKKASAPPPRQPLGVTTNTPFFFTRPANTPRAIACASPTDRIEAPRMSFHGQSIVRR